MPASPAPGFVKFEYHSAAGIHTAQIPTRAWQPPSGGFPFGSYARWNDDVEVDAETMLDDMVTAFTNFLSDTSVMDRWTIYTQATPESDPQPRASKAVSEPGVDTSSTWEEAVQMTLTYRDTNFTQGKVVILDAVSNGVFPKVIAPVASDKYDVLFDELSDPLQAWSSREGYRPSVFVSATWTLNEKARRTYRLT